MFKKALVLLGLVACQFAFAAVDVNKASEADLDGLKGVGPATTRQILAERKKGEFKNWADLMTRVKGIGPARADKLSEQGLTVAGTPYKSGGKAAGKPAAQSPVPADGNPRKAAKDAKDAKEPRKQG